jgi:hypothetical protein
METDGFDDLKKAAENVEARYLRTKMAEVDRSPRTPPALSNATPRPTCQVCGKLMDSVPADADGKKQWTCLYCGATPGVEPALSNATPRPCDHSSVQDLLHQGFAVVMCKQCHEAVTLQVIERAAAPPVAEGPAATPRPYYAKIAADCGFDNRGGTTTAAAAQREWIKQQICPVCGFAGKWYENTFHVLKCGCGLTVDPAHLKLMAEYASDLQRQLMNELTDRSPRTPPQYWRDAINLVHSEANPAPDERTRQHWKDVAALLEGDLLAIKVPAAAPPVAEGPAATPRQQAVSSWGFSEHLIVLPDESQVAQRAEVPEHNSATSDEVAPAKHYAAAAESPEARAAARDWERAINCLLLEVEPSIARDVKAAGDRVIADLQRQLNNWKANARTAREYWRSAEAANQELRSALQLASDELEAWTQRHHEDYGFRVNTERLMRELAALLGPQHGQKEE